MNEIAISVNGVSKCYRVFEDQLSRLLHAVWPMHTKGMQEIWALKDISFNIKRGESVAIIGRNGGGKSTLLEILTGTLMPTTGDVKVFGRVSALLELGSGFNPEYTGRDNVILNGLLLGLAKAEIIARFSEIEAFAEIGSAIDRPVKTYSSGMMMRLAFAVQVLCDPDILIIDEALSVGDFFFQQKCFRHIRKLRDNGTTLLFVSHDMGSVRDICERGIFLREGQSVFDGCNLEAIRHYFQDSNPLAQDSNATPERKSKDVVHEVESRPTSCGITETYLLSIEMLDMDDKPISSIRMGDFIKFLIRYKANDLNNLHVYLAIKNKYDQIVTATGSFNLNISPPDLEPDQISAFELTMPANLEAGQYSYCVSLTLPSEDGTTGQLIDESSWIGPININWDYNTSPPPFYGLVGMGAKVRFVSVDQTPT